MANRDYAGLLAASLAVLTFVLGSGGRLRRVPVLLHNAAWIVALSIVASGLIDYTPNSAWAWFILTAGVLLFNAGALLGSVEPLRKRAELPPPREALVTRAQFKWLLFLYSCGVFIYLGYISARFGLTTLITNPQVIRGSNYLDTLPLPAKLLIYLAPLLFVLLVNKRLVAPSMTLRSRLSLIFYLIVTQATQLQRVLIIIGVLWAIALLLLGGRPQPVQAHKGRQRIAIAAIAVLAVLAFQAIGSALGKSTGTTYTTRQAVTPALRDSSLVGLLTYASASVPAFGQLVESDLNREPPPPAKDNPAAGVDGTYNPQTWGRSTFGSLLKVVPLARPFPADPYTEVPFRTNTYTWLSPYWRDFREPGVILFSLLAGFAFARVARRARTSTPYLLTAGLLVGTSGLAVFANVTISVPVLANLALLLMLARRDAAKHLRNRTGRPAIDVGARTESRSTAAASTDSPRRTPAANAWR